MTDPKEDEFLDDIESAASEEAEVEMIDINEEADRLDELDVIKNERDEFRDRFVRALAEAENARNRPLALTDSLSLLRVISPRSVR